MSAMSPKDIHRRAEELGVEKAHAPLVRMFVLALLAGAFVSLGGASMLVVRSDAELPYAASQLLGGFTFVLGLFLVLSAGAELFTGDCLMTCGSLSQRYGFRRMMVRLAFVYVGNLAGSLVMVALLYACGFFDANGGAVGEVLVSIAASKASLPWGTAFFRGIACNFLVCLAVWIGYGASSVTDKFFAALLPVMGFVICGFEHCVANMFFLPAGLLVQAGGAVAPAAGLDLAGTLSNISAATLGNLVGGAVLVGCAYWLAYGRGAQAAEEGEQA